MADYNDRTAAYAAQTDPIQMQRDAVSVIAELLAGHSDVELRKRPGPGKWSALEIVAHLADDELASAWRYRQMIEQSGRQLSGFNQDMWARLGAYDTWPTEDAFALFRLLREANLRMLSQLTEEEWESWGVHAERGRISVRDLARHMTGHDRNHTDQIRGILTQKSQ